MNTLDAIYSLEDKLHRQGIFDHWLSTEDIQSYLASNCVTRSIEDIHQDLTELWKARIIMQICKSEREHTLATTAKPYYNEPILESPTKTRKVAVFNSSIDLRYRSRNAEIARLLSYNYQRFDMKPGTSLLRYVTKRQERPLFSLPISDVQTRLIEQISKREISTTKGIYKLSSTTKVAHLATATVTVLKALEDHLVESGKEPNIAEFQEESVSNTIAGLYSGAYRKKFDGQIITAGVGSGKTYAFQIGPLIHATYLALQNKRSPSVLFLYPRVVLANNQLLDLTNLVKNIRRINPDVLLPSPILDAGSNLQASVPVGKGRLLRAIRETYSKNTPMIISNLDTLANRISNPEAFPFLAQHLDIIVIDEAHLFSGTYGAHAKALLSRLFLHRKLSRVRSRDQSKPFSEIMTQVAKRTPNAGSNPFVIGASATIAEPKRHLGRLVTSSPNRIEYVEIPASSRQELGFVHHVFLRQRPQSSSMTAATNATSCTIHNRRDGLIQDYYEVGSTIPDPLTGTQPSLRDFRLLRKTLGFSDSLDAVNRWADLVADNESTKRLAMPQRMTSKSVPYFVKFSEPLWRILQTESFAKSTPKWRINLINYYKDHCAKCKTGIRSKIEKTPTSLGSGAEKHSREFWDPDHPKYCLRLLRIDQADWPASRYNRFDDSISVENLDSCPFFHAGLCWWWSEDHLGNNNPGPTMENTRKLSFEQKIVPLAGIRVSSLTSKRSSSDIRTDINETFRVGDNVLFRIGPKKHTDENLAFLIGSPRIEVGVDLSNVSEGLTYRAMRDPAGLQQKVGRIGREPGSDVLVVHIITESTREQYYLRNPELVLDSNYLQPIPLHERSEVIRRSHLYMATFDFILHNQTGKYANRIHREGHRILLINDIDDPGNGIWHDKLAGLIDFLFKGSHAEENRACLIKFLKCLGADDDECTGVLEAVYGDLVDLFSWSDGNKFLVAQEIADYKHEPSPTPSTAPPRVRAFLHEYPRGLGKRSYLFQLLSLKVFQQNTASFKSHRPYSWSPTLFEISGKNYTEIVSMNDQGEAHIGFEPIQIALALLCPGTITYRYHLTPDKVSLSVLPDREHAALQQPGIISAYLDTNNSQFYEEKSTVIHPDELPPGAPCGSNGVPVFLPKKVVLRPAYSKPNATTDGLLVDDDEEHFSSEESSVPAGIPPKCYPLRWYRICNASPAEDILSRMERKYAVNFGPDQHPIHSVFERVNYHASIGITEFVWGLDRSFAARSITNSRLLYRDQDRQPVAIGQTFSAPGMSFRISTNSPYFLATLESISNTRESAAYQHLLIHTLDFFLSDFSATRPRSTTGRELDDTSPSVFTLRDLSKIIWFHLLTEWHRSRSADRSTAPHFNLSDLQGVFNPSHHAFLSRSIFSSICNRLAEVQDPEDPSSRAATLTSTYENFLAASRNRIRLDVQYQERVLVRLLANTLGVALLNAGLRTSGAEDRDLKYFHQVHNDHFVIYLFDSDEGGNGSVDAIRENFFISTIEHALEDKKVALRMSIDPLPDTDFLSELEEELNECELSQAARFSFFQADASLRYGPRPDIISSESRASGPAFMHIRKSLGIEDFDSIGVFQQCPEFLASTGESPAQLIPSAQYPNFSALENSMYFCLDGCISCQVSPEANVYGPNRSRTTISKLILDQFYQTCVNLHPNAQQFYPGNGIGRTIAASELTRYQARMMATPLPTTGFDITLSSSDDSEDVVIRITPSLSLGRWDLVTRPTPLSTSLSTPRLRLRMRI